MNLLPKLFPSHGAEPAVEINDVGTDCQPRILFTGDDFEWARGERQIGGRKFVCVNAADDAKALLSMGPFDAVVAGFQDLKQSVSLLETAVSTQPSLACAVRADSEEVKGTAISYPVLHRTKSVAVMDDMLRTLLAAAAWRRNSALNSLRAEIRKFPALPSLYGQITSALQDDSTSVDRIAELVAREPAVSVKLLQVVNSPVFGLRQRITSVRDAANFLGFTRLRSLVLATSLFGQCDSSKCRSFSAETFESHSLQVATWASTIAAAESGSKKLGEMAFTAGLLHQFGSLLLAANLPDGYNRVLQTARDQRLSIARVERDSYGVTHAELAGTILASWGIPFPIVNGVGWYSLPSQSEDEEFSALTAVHVAAAIDSFANSGVPDFDRAYLERLDFVSRFSDWSQALIGKVWEE